MTRCVIGVDIGTTSTKAVVYAADVAQRGQVLGQHAVEYPLDTPVPGAAEQDPERIHQAVVVAIRNAVLASKVIPEDIACVAFSAAMHSLIAIDDYDRPLTPSYTWADSRAAPWATMVNEQHDGLAIYRRTGTPIHPMSPLIKLLWLRHEQPDIWQRARRFIGIKEFVLRRLCGEYVVDHSIASATGLFNLETLDWDAGALALVGIDASQLSSLVPTTQRLNLMDAVLASSIGVAADTPVVIGANDGVLSNLGVGAIDRGAVALTIGTSGALRTVVDRPHTDPEGRTFCYALTGQHWVVGGPVNNGGIVLRWVRDQLAAEVSDQARCDGIDPYDALAAIAQRVPAGAGGLLFHPYLTGERAPLWNADLRGSFFGLAVHHRKQHMIRAVFEGVLMNLQTILPAVEALTGPTHVIKATGGFARSAMWRQMLADVFDREVVVPESIESSCFGAAVLGLFALGEIAALEDVAGLIGATHRHRPDPDDAAIYRRLAPIFSALPRRLENEYRAIAAFQRDLP
jgi:gluconokinase